MDTAGDVVSPPSTSFPPHEEPASGSACDNSSQSSLKDSPCRKSSRLKAKKNQQSQQSQQIQGSQQSRGSKPSQETQGSQPSEGSGEWYNLRLSSLVKRVQVEQRRTAPKTPKGKSRPAPLSKYRRRSANARERLRMREINEGYERLRHCLPQAQLSKPGCKGDKPTKLAILSLALNYIHALRDVLGFKPLDGIGDEGGVVDGCRGGGGETGTEESELGSDAASTHTPSVSSSSASCDESLSSPSPGSSSWDLKDFCPAEEARESVLLASHSSSCPRLASDCPPATQCPEDGSSSSAASLASLSSSSPSTPPLPLPEDCMDLDQADLLDVSVALADLGPIEDILL